MKIPWKLVAIGVGVLIVLGVIGSVTGTNKKLYNMALDQLREDQSQAIKDKDKWIKTCEDEILILSTEKAQVQREKLILQKRDIESQAEIARLVGENNELQNRLDNIIVSDDPDKLLEDLRGRGINIRRVAPGSR